MAKKSKKMKVFMAGSPMKGAPKMKKHRSPKKGY